ncbi:hypothetical protein DVW12_16960 [Clostridium botulinum]|nr:hypothetical protein [Clostridium botulinum]
MNISINKLVSQIEKTSKINEDDILVRELLELCYQNYRTPQFSDLSKFNSKIFIKAYKEIFKTNMEDMKIIKDMISSEYLLENLNSSDIYIYDEDEIY